MKPFRILIRGTNWLGDSVISVPAVRAIKRGRPDAHVTVAAPEKLAAVWKLVPEVDEVLALPARFAARHRALIEAHGSHSMRPSSFRIRFARARGLARRHSASRRLCGTSSALAAEPDRPGRARALDRSSIRSITISTSRAISALRSTPARCLAPTSRKYCPRQTRASVCAPARNTGPAKRWLPERFAEVAQRIAEERDVSWTFFGTAADAGNGKIIADALGDRCSNRIGQTTLEQLATELRGCALLLTNDTGTMHLATLLGVPVVAVFGSTEHRLTGPLGDGNVVIRHHVECSPCFLRECPIDFRCMHAVTR